MINVDHGTGVPAQSIQLRTGFGFRSVQCTHGLMSLWDAVGSGADLGIPAPRTQRVQTERQSTVGHGQIVHDLVVEEIARSG